jgi:hypothetical protein
MRNSALSTEDQAVRTILSVDVVLLGFGAVSTYREMSVFRRNILCSSSGLKRRCWEVKGFMLGSAFPFFSPI